jgi:V/A-type H+-transporting ATPase subunit E
MSHLVQELINKIKVEGIEAADMKSKEIEHQAQLRAQKIVQDAQRKAELIVTEADLEVKKMKESAHIALKHASRDTILSLKKEIQKTLQKVASTQISEALSADHLTQTLTHIIEKTLEHQGKDMSLQVAVSPKDIEKIKSVILNKFQKQLKHPIHVQASNDIGHGFTISFDAGKSSFDFSDQSLAEYLGNFLNPQLAALITEASGS